MTVTQQLDLTSGRFIVECAPPVTRTVHALFADGSELAHYLHDRHWYVEQPDGIHREKVTLAEAVALAQTADRVFLREPGGMQFDARLRKLGVAA